MHRNLIVLALSAIAGLSSSVPALAQVTNFTPVRMKVERVADPQVPRPGVFISFSANVGRIYRIESSADLARWTLVKQVVGDDTNMSVFVPITNMMTVFTNGRGTNVVSPLPGVGTYTLSTAQFSSASLSTSGGKTMTLSSTSLDTQWSGGPPLPYPWEPMYQPRVTPDYLYPSTASQLSVAGANSLSMLSRDTIQSSTTLAAAGTEPASPPADALFYRVICPEDRIQFPNWYPFVDQYMNFTMWTPLAGGTFRVELYRDGQPVFTNIATVPSSGYFSVRDASYNSANWPYSGFYQAKQWEAHISVTPAGGGTNIASTIVQKMQRNPSWTYRRGITVQMDPATVIASAVWASKQARYNISMQNVFLGAYHGAAQVDLNGSPKSIYEQTPEQLVSTNDWSRLLNLLGGSNAQDPNHQPGILSDIHYFGQGASTALGTNQPGMYFHLYDLDQTSLATNPLFYAAVDGCALGNTVSILKMFTGYGRPHPRVQYATNGWQPAFAWGWKGYKPIDYLNNATQFDDHMSFVVDFYNYLVQTDPYTGLMMHTLIEAVNFAKDPNGMGIDSGVHHNAQGANFIYTGCTDCWFDEF